MTASHSLRYLTLLHACFTDTFELDLLKLISLLSERRPISTQPMNYGQLNLTSG